MSDYAGLEVVPIGGGSTAFTSEEAGEKGTCNECGKVLTITAKGELRSHKCINDVQSGKTNASGTPKGRRNRAPLSVQKLGVALIASGVEVTSAQIMARYVPCKASEVPSDLGPHADDMIGPIIDGIWPTLPKSAQKAIKAVADESELIAAAFAWWEYGQRLKDWGDKERERRSADIRPTRGYENEQVSRPANGSGLGVNFGQPFIPDPAS